MSITNSFKEAVEKGDVRAIRIMMKDSLLVDPTFSEFHEMEKLVRNILGLYDPHDGRALNDDKLAWNDEYMNKIMVQVVGNFSHERVSHLKEVVEYLRPISVSDRIKTQKSASNISKPDYSKSDKQTHLGHTDYQKQKYQDQKNGSYRGAKIAVGAIVGATVGGVIAASASVTVLGGTVSGLIIGGAVAIVITKGE